MTVASGPDLTTALMAAISKAIIETSPPNPRQPGGHLVDLVVSRGALMGVLSLIAECDPNLGDADIAMVGRNIGEAMTKQIGAARQLYKQTGTRMWVAAGKIWDDDDGEVMR
jgi:hypothetical protein